MKINLNLLILFFAIILGTSSCKNSDSDADDISIEHDFSLTLKDFTNNTVVATYADMKTKSATLYHYIQSFEVSGSQVDIDSACSAWRATRVPWEQSESFLFGPAETNSLDPLLDSWPLDKAQLDQVLASSQNITTDYVRNGLGAVLRGFHTIEYLLFSEGKAKKASTITAREKSYLKAASEVLKDDCLRLWALWHGKEGITGEDAARLDELGINAGVGFASEFINSGNVGSRYLSQKDAIDEIIQGCIGIADEVANGKIADPFNTKDVLQVESWFSWNSLTDFVNNIKSIENAFYGGTNEKNRSANNLAAMVKKLKPELEAQLASKISIAKQSILAIPAPFRNNLDKAAPIEAAMAAVNDLIPVLESIKGLFE